MKIDRAGLDDFPAIAALIAAECEHPATQCVHSSSGESVEELLGEMKKWHTTDEIRFVTAYDEDGKLVGTMGCEFDREAGRGWLRGPFALQNWDELAPALYQAMRAYLPEAIHKLDSFLTIQNERGNAFYLAQGFERKTIGHVYAAPRPRILPGPDEHCHPIQPEHQAAFSQIHDAIFPNTYYNGRQILAQLDDTHQVFVYVQKGEVLGYVNVILEPWAEEGYIEFLGVREDARRQGIGRKLLSTALHWAFSTQQVPQIGLTVSDENVNARDLYTLTGFQLLYTGVNTCLEW